MPRRVVSCFGDRQCLGGMTEHSAHRKVVVIGGGYAGTTTANHLLLSLLAPDATWTADSGGKTTASRRPVVGAEPVAALLIDLFHANRNRPDMRIEMINCNNTPALAAYRGDRLEGVFLIEVTDGEITNFYAIRNPDKLLALAAPRQISRQEAPAGRRREVAV